MSATYCFMDRRRELFAEAVARGWIAAWRDCPNFKGHEGCTTQALVEAAVLRDDVCCIQERDAAYQQLFTVAWLGSYESVVRLVAEKRLTEYAHAVFATTLQRVLSVDEALRIMRPRFESGEGLAEIERGYAQFVAATSARS